MVKWLQLGDQRASRAGGQAGHHIQLLALAGGGVGKCGFGKTARIIGP